MSRLRVPACGGQAADITLTMMLPLLLPGIAADYDSEGRLAGLEILDVQKRFGGRETMRRVELERVGS